MSAANVTDNRKSGYLTFQKIQDNETSDKV